jgi:GTP-binding protein LepA
MPLRELMRGFFDKVKSVSSGYASVSYEFGEMRPADVCRMDILVADEPVPAFTRVVAKRRVEEEAEASVERLFTVMPRQQFVAKVQAYALGRIISSKNTQSVPEGCDCKIVRGRHHTKDETSGKTEERQEKDAGNG